MSSCERLSRQVWNLYLIHVRGFVLKLKKNIAYYLAVQGASCLD